MPSMALGTWWGMTGGAQPSPTLTSSSFSRMSFSVSASGTGGMTGMGKSVPLSRVSLLWAERGGEDAARAPPAPHGGHFPMGAAAPETPNLADTHHPPAETLSPPDQGRTQPFSQQGEIWAAPGIPPNLSSPDPLKTSLGVTQGSTTTARGATEPPEHRVLPGCFKVGSGSPHPMFSLLL